MKIGYQAVHDIEFETRDDKKIRLAFTGYNAAFRVPGPFQCPDDSGPHRDHAMILPFDTINEISRLLIDLIIFLTDPVVPDIL